MTFEFQTSHLPRAVASPCCLLFSRSEGFSNKIGVLFGDLEYAIDLALKRRTQSYSYSPTILGKAYCHIRAQSWDQL